MILKTAENAQNVIEDFSDIITKWCTHKTGFLSSPLFSPQVISKSGNLSLNLCAQY
jgi:hypothetical protein